MQGKVAIPFPLGPSSPPKGAPFSQSLNWDFKSCDNSQFFCLDAFDRATKQSRQLFVPREPSVGREYHYLGATAFITGVSSFIKTPAIQVIVSQTIAGRTQALKMTIRRGVGVVAFDGINFWQPVDFERGETCILESHLGFFHNVDIVVPPPKHVID